MILGNMQNLSYWLSTFRDMTSQKFPLEQGIAFRNRAKREKNHFYP